MNSNGSSVLNEIMQDLGRGSIAQILLIIFVAWLFVVATERIVGWASTRVSGQLRHYILPVAPIVRFLIVVIALYQITILIINVTEQNPFAVLATAGLAIGFAFKDYVSSIVAGMVVLFERPYRPGDWVEVGRDYGEVKSVGLRSFQMVTPDDTTITVPHLRIWTENIASANDGKSQHMCIANFYLHPAHDAPHIRQVLYDIAHTSVYTDVTRPVLVIVHEEPWGTRYRLKAYPIDGRQEFQFISDLTVRGKRMLAELGVRPAIAPAAATPPTTFNASERSLDSLNW